MNFFALKSTKHKAHDFTIITFHAILKIDKYPHAL